ncbi:hypothetical protein CFN78_08540 [Amycolatopsis antarctica]|uniref:Uncharacterized protein n=1 Tax=Amycolatopsis antarctica TaxID=1854586 RepID=A0A263D5B8_9PSEU|nr:hypothetical protein [Amycolatopsis antarctica]OZM73571.1 hypothetical protein CFN78_08540 [Amycolatopsis antarctica]
MSGQEDLFGNSIDITADTTESTVKTTNDMGLIEHVIGIASASGYVLVGTGEKVFRKISNDQIEGTPAYEADAVHQLITRKWLKVGGTHVYRCGGREGPARSVLVPRSTKEKAHRWRALKPLTGSARLRKAG